MREIIQIQVGQAGNKAGIQFWEDISREHSLFQLPDKSQTGRVDVYFEERNSGDYYARGIMADLDCQSINSVKMNPTSKLFQDDCFLSGSEGAGHNWAKGHFGEGEVLTENLLDIVRKKTEDCDCLQGFQVVHSLGGGTGSGMGSLLISRLQEEFPDRILNTFSIFPYAAITDSVVEPYNATLSMKDLIENVDLVHNLENEALFRIGFQTYKLTAPTFDDVDRFMSSAMSGLTCGFRYSDQFNSDMRKLSMELAPMPRMHFLSISCASFNKMKENPNQLIEKLLSQESNMSLSDLHEGFCFGSSLTLRGKFDNQQEIQEDLGKKAFLKNPKISSYLDDNCDDFSGVLNANSSSIQIPLQELSKRFQILLSKKAFLYHYLGEGMEEGEFVEALSHLNNLIMDFQEAKNS